MSGYDNEESKLTAMPAGHKFMAEISDEELPNGLEDYL